jgi:hypothetical protein
MTFIFAAFIFPTSITASEGVRIAEAYLNRTGTLFHNYRTTALVILIAIFIAAWIYNRSFAEGLSIIVVIVAALTLVIAIPNASFPLQIRLASRYAWPVQMNITWSLGCLPGPSDTLGSTY